MVNSFKMSEGAETLITTQAAKMILSNNMSSNLHDVSLPANSTDFSSFIDKSTKGIDNLLAYRLSPIANRRLVIGHLSRLYH